MKKILLAITLIGGMMGGVNGQNDLKGYNPSAACSTAPTSVNANPGNSICLGESVTLTQVGGVLGAIGDFYWYANSCGGTSLGTGNSNTFSPTVTTTYYVRAEDTCGVTACASVTITVNPLPIVNLGPDVSICAGNAVQLNAAGFLSYLWSTGANTSTINVSTAGTYTLTVSDVNGCTGSDNVTVTVLPLPTAMMTGIASICAGQSALLTIAFTGTGPWNYAYNTPQGVVNAFTAVTPVSIPVNPSATFNYTMVAVSNPNCSGSVTGNALITVNPLPAAIISGNANICIGSCTNLSVVFTGTLPFTYSYSNGTTTFGPFTTSSTNTIINVCPTVSTTYTLTAISDANCQGTVSGSAIITVNPNPLALITPSATVFMCSDDTAHFTANTGAGFMYQWYKNSIAIAGAVNSFYNATANGLYSFMITDLNGCSGTSASTQVQIICQPADTNLGLRMGSVSDNDIVLVPNPASTEITIHSENVIQSIAIYDVMGQKVFSMQLTEQTSNFKLQTSNFPDGIYFVEVINGKQKSINKFIKN